MFNREPKPSKIKYPEKSGEAVSPSFYFDVMRGIFENIGESSPLHKMADELCKEFGIASGPTSALSRARFDSKNEPEAYAKAKEHDRIIGTVFGSIPGVYVGMGENTFGEEAPIVTMDINKILDALEEGQGDIEIKFQEFISALPEKDGRIIMAERELRKEKKEQFKGSENASETNCPVVYFRVPGGVGVFLRGYVHSGQWQKNFGMELADIYADSSVVLIEGSPYKSIGESLGSWESYVGEYDVLMREIAHLNPNIRLGEVDGRDESKLSMDVGYFSNSINLPAEFYKNYYTYLTKINPKLAKEVASPQVLQELLRLQSTSLQGVIWRDFALKDHSKDVEFDSYPSVDKRGKSLSHMTGFELGSAIYSDALSAIKLYLLVRLSSDKHLPVGPIADFQGTSHLSGKTFFMQYPQYALMVVIMNAHQLMAGHATKLVSNEVTAVEYSKEIFLNPNWEDVVNEILKLPIFSVEADPEKTVDIGANQKELIDQSPDFAGIYGINVSKIAEDLKSLFDSKTS